MRILKYTLGEFGQQCLCLLRSEGGVEAANYRCVRSMERLSIKPNKLDTPVTNLCAQPVTDGADVSLRIVHEEAGLGAEGGEQREADLGRSHSQFSCFQLAAQPLAFPGEGYVPFELGRGIPSVR